MSWGNTELDEIHLLDGDVDPYLGLLWSTILQLHVLVILGLLEIRQLGRQFGYTCRMLMRILVQDGGRRMIGIQQGLWLGVGHTGLAIGSETDCSSRVHNIKAIGKREERTKTYRWISGHTSWTSLYHWIDPVRPVISFTYEPLLQSTHLKP